MAIIRLASPTVPEALAAAGADGAIAVTVLGGVDVVGSQPAMARSIVSAVARLFA